MSKLYYTPAPWIVTEDVPIHMTQRRHALSIVAERDFEFLKSSQQPFGLIALVSPMSFVTPVDVGNAKLIAAAPEMYQLLKELRDYIENDNKVIPGDIYHKQANQLLNKLHSDRVDYALPKDPAEFMKIVKTASYKELVDRGFRAVSMEDKRYLLLIPFDWYTRIPNGFLIHYLNKKSCSFQLGKADDTAMNGVLPYGIVRSFEDYEIKKANQ